MKPRFPSFLREESRGVGSVLRTAFEARVDP